MIFPEVFDVIPTLLVAILAKNNEQLEHLAKQLEPHLLPSATLEQKHLFVKKQLRKADRNLDIDKYKYIDMYSYI